MTDFVQDLEAELLDAARRRAKRRPRPRIAWRPIAIAVAAIAALLIAALTLRPSEHPATPKPGAFVPPLATPIRACDGTRPPDLPNTFQPIDGPAPPRDLAVLRRPYQGTDQMLAQAPPLRTWLPSGSFDPLSVRRGSIPATYVVPAGDLRTAPPACGGSRKLGAGVCLLMQTDYACFTLGEIREGRAFARAGIHVVGIVPDGVRWVRLGDSAALADGNLVHVVGKVWPFRVTFERDAPRVAVLNATATPGRATRLADRLESLLGNHPQAGNALREAARSAVIAVRPRDAMFAQAVARYAGIPLLGSPDMARRFGAPADADVVVVLGTRMR